MSDIKLVVSTDSWHARRFHEVAGNVQTSNLCHYFWLVVKSLLASVFSTKFIKLSGRGIGNLALWIFIGVVTIALTALVAVVFLLVVSMIAAWILALVAWMSGSGITPQNTMPFFVTIRGDGTPLTHTDAVSLVYFSAIFDSLMMLVLTVWGVTEYNKKHSAGFIRLSWERFKVWKDGTVVCPLIEFEETN